MRPRAEGARKGTPKVRASKSSVTAPVAVTGMHRTGSSMVAKMLRLGGLWFGDDEDFISPASDNPEGFFEHERLVRLNDELLEATGGAWDHPPASGPLAVDDPRIAGLAVRARGTAGELSVHGSWGWKDPRICLTAAFWLDLLPDLHFIVCVRHPVEVAMSLKRRNRISYALALSLWETYYTRLLEVVPPDRRLVTHYGAHFDSSRNEANRVLDFAAVPRRGRSTAFEAINPELRHQRAQISLADAGVGPATIKLYRRLCEDAGWGAEDDATNSPTRVNRAVLDLAAAEDLADKRGRVVDVLEGRVGDLQDERDRLGARVEQLEETSKLLAERLKAAESDTTKAILTSMDERMEALEHSVYDLLYRSVVGDRADDQVVTACRQVVLANVPLRAPVLVAGKSDPAFTEIYGRRVTNFPQDGIGRYPGFALANSQALVAHLEALRCAGHRFLLMPSPSRWMLDHYASFGEHLLNRYRVVASDPSFGILVDITDRRGRTDLWPTGVSATIGRIAVAVERPLAVLDLTQLDLASRMPNYNVFPPPRSDGELPYLDSTIDVVVIDNDLQLSEARRAAVEALVRVRCGSSGLPEVESVELLSEEDPEAEAQIAVVVGTESLSTAWLERMAEALAEEPSAFLATKLSPDVLERAAMVALVDDDVLPLPSCLSAASAVLSSDDGIGGVAIKILGANGSLEAAGTTLFADGSYAGVGSGSFDVAAAWHEYVRETCWGPGLMLYRVDAVKEMVQAGLSPRAQPLWAERVWAAGYRVLYQPAAAAVRAVPSAAVGANEAVASWSSHLRGRPQRPPVLDEMAWRELLAMDDVAGSMQ
jgi:hypothetical protein